MDTRKFIQKIIDEELTMCYRAQSKSLSPKDRRRTFI